MFFHLIATLHKLVCLQPTSRRHCSFPCGFSVFTQGLLLCMGPPRLQCGTARHNLARNGPMLHILAWSISTSLGRWSPAWWRRADDANIITKQLKQPTRHRWWGDPLPHRPTGAGIGLLVCVCVLRNWRLRAPLFKLSRGPTMHMQTRVQFQKHPTWLAVHAHGKDKTHKHIHTPSLWRKAVRNVRVPPNGLMMHFLWKTQYLTLTGTRGHNNKVL